MQISPGTDPYRADFDTIRLAVSLELLTEEPAVENKKPLFDHCCVIVPGKGTAGKGLDLCRRKAPAQHVVQEEIMQSVRSYKILCLLADPTRRVRRQQLRADGCIHNIC